ncbi:QsdR family transcriptional regulator [Qaidamihabitans albus]|uniref:QsdR family transcriptional regulator n=1 Tax=Qaidamihabitans albus TaxID=2795733 RepID=UPI0018F22E6C|nr:QsdR family transcriptional regulator [Qaidamihabitans albus]
MAGPTCTRRVISRERVVRGACRFFLRHGTVDMDALAPDLAISRATLYRVVHSRDALLGDVLWRLGEELLDRARRRRTLSGVDGVLEVTRHFAGYLWDAGPFRTFLHAEPDTAARILFTASGRVHRRAVHAQRQILLESDAGTWPSADLDGLAYLYLRIVESALYAELLHGRRLDLAAAEPAARAVLTPR